MRPRKRRKVETSPNSKFVNIKHIHKAQQEAAGIEIEDGESDTSSIFVVVEDCI
jgi:hypothetical protein